MNISAVLLAGGESRRMGRDKARLIFRGKPLWELQLDLLWELETAEMFISARSDPAWRPSGVQFVSDEPPSRGPLSGLAATLARIRADHLLALAIDMPFMTQQYLRSLCNLIEPGRGVLPIIGDRAEPLAAIYPKAARSEFVAALSGSDFSLQSLTRKLVEAGKLSLVNVSKAEENSFRNFNDLSDFDWCGADLFSAHPKNTDEKAGENRLKAEGDEGRARHPARRMDL
jgi:molybdopterin-guanine dinucleotide biosynthesis protein A